MPPLKTPTGKLADLDANKSGTVNHQFKQSFSNENTNSIPYLRRSFPRMPDISVTDEVVRKLLQGLKTSKAAGPDNIHPRVLKEVASEKLPILRHIFQKSLDSVHLPTDWRIAIIFPLYKKGDRSCPTNYQSISLTSIVSKVLEHIVCSNLMRHMDAHNRDLKVRQRG